MKRRFGHTEFEFVVGDITEEDVDAIVNAANNHFWMGAGVAGAIKRRGGEEIEREAVSQGPACIGSARVTSAGRLKARYVIHAAVMGQDLVTSEDFILKATRSCMEKARELEIASISFPALGTGVGGFPVERAGEIMVSACRDALADCPRLQLVRFVLFNEQTYEEFVRGAGRVK